MKYSEMKWIVIDGVSRPVCPKCGAAMAKGGSGHSGLHEYQSYRCLKIDKTTGEKCLTTFLNTREPYVRKVVQRK